MRGTSPRMTKKTRLFGRTCSMSKSLRCAASLAIVAALAATPAAAQTCATMRKINVGVSVSPPNVVHTAAYVAKELGIFARHCIDVTLIQFDGGSSPAASVALTQGSTFTTVSDVQV